MKYGLFIIAVSLVFLMYYKLNSKDNSLKKDYEKTIKLLESFKRTAYIPETKEQKPEFNKKSKFGGLPYLRNENDWPTCPNCKKKFKLFLQLDLEKIPERKSEGILQLFYCFNEKPYCEDDLQSYLPFSKGVVCRIIDHSEAPVSVAYTEDDYLKENEVLSWEAIDDYPHFEEYDELGIYEKLNSKYADEIFEILDEEEKCQTSDVDKLFGWPYWVQGVEYPNDRNTDKRMEMIFQIASEINLDHMFGDSGIGHITQSPSNKNELAFGWACY